MHDSNEKTITLEGLIERVTYHNPDNGYCVLRLKVKGERGLITLVGHTPTVTAGEYVIARGIWTTNKEYGKQFKASVLKVEPPTTLFGIEKYLGSGMVKGIGPIYAKKLVETFGKDVFEVIEKNPERLDEVEGIGPKRRQMIVGGWADQKIIREIMVFLHSHGVSTSRAVRIFKTYGENAIEIVKDNPYRLVQDIRGIGFKSADTIAQKLGISHDSLVRARAGLNYALLESSANNGHCCLPRNDLIKLARDLLGITEPILIKAIDEEIADKNLIRDRFPVPDSIYPRALYNAECSLVKSINQLKAFPVPWANIDSGKAIPWVEKKLQITLSKSQKEAVKQALSSKLLVITGGPGVGKTTLVRSILTILQAKKVKTQLCAPTGRAAKRLAESTGQKAKTIHRLLEIDPATGQFKRNEWSPLECDLLVIDEASMVDVQLANSLFKAIHQRTAVIIVGDVDQLPSVGPGSVLSDLIESKSLPVIRLTEVFRQAASSWIIKAAHKINKGLFPDLPKKGDISDFYLISLEEPEKVSETIVDLVKRRLPNAYKVNPIKDIQVLCPMNKSLTGARAINDLLQEALNPPTEDSITMFGMTFSVGDKVMQIENNYDKNVYNGDIGLVSAIDKTEGQVLVDFDGSKVSYAFEELDEIVLCYATTVHKSQGSEYPIVIIPVTSQHFVMLKRNLIYTGVTRGKQLVILVGQQKALNQAIKSGTGIDRNTGLRQRLAQQSGFYARNHRVTT